MSKNFCLLLIVVGGLVALVASEAWQIAGLLFAFAGAASLLADVIEDRIEARRRDRFRVDDPSRFRR